MHAGTLEFLPEPTPRMKSILTIPEGNYLCMYVCGMPYQQEPILKFWEEVKASGRKTSGDIYSFCILDSVFHNETMQEDFGMLQVRLSE